MIYQLGCVKLRSLDGFQSILFCFTFLDQKRKKTDFALYLYGECPVWYGRVHPRVAKGEVKIVAVVVTDVHVHWGKII